MSERMKLFIGIDARVKGNGNTFAITFEWVDPVEKPGGEQDHQSGYRLDRDRAAPGVIGEPATRVYRVPPESGKDRFKGVGCGCFFSWGYTR